MQSSIGPLKPSSWWGALAIAAALSLGGCQGCDTPPSWLPLNGSYDVDDLTGLWQVDAFSQDEQGCAPTPARPPIAFLSIDAVDDEGHEPQLRLRPCQSEDSDTCAAEVAPDNRLTWSFEDQQATTLHHSATLESSQPAQNECRFTATRSVITPGSETLEITRSHYAITLPLEGDQSCRPEQAAAYQDLLPCTRSETLELHRSE